MKPTTRRVNIARRHAFCPICSSAGKRHSTGERRLSDLGTDGPVEIVLTFSKHYCPKCRKHFTPHANNIVADRSKYTNRVKAKALELLFKGGLNLPQTCHRMRDRYHVILHESTIHDWKAEAIRERNCQQEIDSSSPQIERRACQ